MSSLDSLMSRSYAAKGVAAQVGTDQPVALRLRILPSAGAITTVKSTTGTSIEIVTANGGTDTFAFATYSTVGTLVDAINSGRSAENIAAGVYTVVAEAKVLDTLRSQTTVGNQFVNGTLVAKAVDGITYYDVMVDTNVALFLAYRLTNDRGVGETKPRGSHRVKLQEFAYYATLSGAGVDKVQVWECNGAVETEVINYLSVNNTLTTINFASGNGTLTASDGNDIVVVLKDTVLADNTTNFLRVTGILE